MIIGRQYSTMFLYSQCDYNWMMVQNLLLTVLLWKLFQCSSSNSPLSLFSSRSAIHYFSIISGLFRGIGKNRSDDAMHLHRVKRELEEQAGKAKRAIRFILENFSELRVTDGLLDGKSGYYDHQGWRAKITAKSTGNPMCIQYEPSRERLVFFTSTFGWPKNKNKIKYKKVKRNRRKAGIYIGGNL